MNTPIKIRDVKVTRILDQLWALFASVRTAIVLIFLLTVATIGGSLVEQEGLYPSALAPDQYYPIRYGQVLGTFLLRTGLTHAYSSTWYMTLLGLTTVNLVVCSIHRFNPLWRAVNNPRVLRGAGELRSLAISHTLPAAPGVLERARAELAKQGYRLHDAGEGALYAEKGRWGRWGPYIIHVGLLFLVAAGIPRFIPGWYTDNMVWLGDGETAPVPGTPWTLKNNHFTIQFYDDGRPKLYRTDAVLMEGNQELVRQEIKVNVPLIHQGYTIYQNSFQTTMGTAEVVMKSQENGQEVGRFSVDLAKPGALYQVGEIQVRVKDYFPDFMLGDDMKPVNRSGDANNPGLLISVIDADGTETADQWLFIHYPEMSFRPDSPYRFTVTETTLRNTTGLRVKRDPGLPLIYVGQVIIMGGLVLTYYLSHRRYWLMLQNGQLLIGAVSNRYQKPFAREAERFAQTLSEGSKPC